MPSILAVYISNGDRTGVLSVTRQRESGAYQRKKPLQGDLEDILSLLLPPLGLHRRQSCVGFFGQVSYNRVTGT